MSHEEDCTEGRPCAECDYYTRMETLRNGHEDPLAILRAAVSDGVDAEDLIAAYKAQRERVELRRALLQIGLVRFGEYEMFNSPHEVFGRDKKELED